MKSKLIGVAAALAVVLGGSYFAWAALNFMPASRVLSVGVHSQSLGAKSWVQLEATSTISGCNLLSGRAVFAIEDNARGDKLLSIVNAAMLARKQIIVAADPAAPKVDGYCEARAIYFLQ